MSSPDADVRNAFAAKASSGTRWRRLAAFILDILVFYLWVGILTAVSLLGASRLMPNGFLAQQVLFDALTLVPLILAQGWQESRFAKTIGKRAMGIVVKARDGAMLPLGTSLVRNAVKIGLPWFFGHVAAAWGISNVTDTTPWWVWGSVTIAYAIVAWWVIGVFSAQGRTMYDRITGSQVISESRR